MNTKYIGGIIVSLLILILGFAYYRSSTSSKGPALPPPAPIVINPIENVPAPVKVTRPLGLIKTDLASGTATSAALQTVKK